MPVKEADSEELRDPTFRQSQKCTIFLAYTSNMISCGIRDTIRYLARNRMVGCCGIYCVGLL